MTRPLNFTSGGYPVAARWTGRRTGEATMSDKPASYLNPDAVNRTVEHGNDDRSSK